MLVLLGHWGWPGKPQVQGEPFHTLQSVGPRGSSEGLSLLDQSRLLPPGKQASSVALFLKDASWVCFQLSKVCHSKVFLLTQKPQGEVWRCFSLSFEGQRCSPLPCASSGTSQKGRCPASVHSALLVSQRRKIQSRHISAAPEARFCKE